MSFDKEEVKTAASGRWREILIALGGVDSARLDGSQGPCPKCGGTDRFRAFNDFAETGAVFCNQCFDKRNGDGIATLQWLNDWTFPNALDEVAKHLGLSPSNGTTNGHHHPPGEKPAPSTARATGTSKPDWRKSWDAGQARDRKRRGALPG